MLENVYSLMKNVHEQCRTIFKHIYANTMSVWKQNNYCWPKIFQTDISRHRKSLCVLKRSIQREERSRRILIQFWINFVVTRTEGLLMPSPALPPSHSLCTSCVSLLPQLLQEKSRLTFLPLPPILLLWASV